MRPSSNAIALGLVRLSLRRAQAQSWMPPPESQRCPSKWGAGDERGSANHMKPASVLKAAKLIRTGEVIEIGHVLRAGMPLQATRQFNLHTKRTIMNPQSNQRGSNEELVTTELGQVGTQFDGFAHQTPRRQPVQLLQGERDRDAHRLHQARHRESRRPDDARRADRRRRLKGVETLPDSYEITRGGPAAGAASGRT